MQSDSIRGNQKPSSRQSDAITGNHIHSEAIKGNQRQSSQAIIAGNHRRQSSEAAISPRVRTLVNA